MDFTRNHPLTAAHALSFRPVSADTKKQLRYMSQETLQNMTKTAENLRGFRADSVKLPCSYLRSYSTTSAERVSPFRGMILPCPQICPYPVNVFVLRGTRLLCTNMAHKLLTGSYVCTYITHYTVSLRAGDSKTTVSTYAAVIRT